MEKIGDKIYFDSDDEFTDFCVKPYATVAYLQNGSPYIKGDYSDEYKREEPVSEETIQKVREGMDLFVEYFQDLWN